jgi:hypothetical protein
LSDQDKYITEDTMDTSSQFIRKDCQQYKFDTQRSMIKEDGRGYSRKTKSSTRVFELRVLWNHYLSPFTTGLLNVETGFFSKSSILLESSK